MLDAIALDGVRLRTKLLIAFVLVALLVGVTGAVGYTGVGTVDGEADDMARGVEKVEYAADLVIALERQQAAVLAAQTGDSNARQRFNERVKEFDQAAENLEATGLSTTQEERLSTLQTMHTRYASLAEEFFAANRFGNDDRADQKVRQMATVRDSMDNTARAIESSARDDVNSQATTIQQTTQSTQQRVLGLTGVALVVSVGLGLFVSRRMSRSIERLSTAATAISNGDLDADVDDHTANDEIGRLVEAFQGMQRDLQAIFDDLDDVSRNLKTGTLTQEFDTDYPGTYGEVMGNLDEGTDRLSTSFDRISAASADLERGRLDRRVDADLPGTYGDVLADFESGLAELSHSVGSARTIAREVATSSEEVSASAAEIETAGEEVAGSIEEISQGTEQQSETLQEVATEMTDMSATVEEIASSSVDVAETAEAAAERATEGSEQASEASREISEIEAEAEGAVEQVAALQSEMDEISEIVDMINEIAEQTNMLALNASIEAARAGEAGEGFAVVADEIKGLAGEAADATEQVDALIGELQATTGETVDDIESMRDRVESGAATIEESIAMFDEIAETATDAEHGVREISAATDDQAASTEEVVAMVDQVAGVSQQTAAEASNVSAASEEQTASLSEASQNIEHLSSLADQLHEQVSDFAVRDGDEGTAGSDELAASPADAPASPDEATPAAADGGFDFPDAAPDGTQRD